MLNLNQELNFKLIIKKGFRRCFLPSSITCDKRGQEGNSEQQEAIISQTQLEDNVALINLFLSNP